MPILRERRDESTIRDEGDESLPPDVFLWSIVAYGVSAAGLLVSTLVVGLVVGLGLDGLLTRGSFHAGLADDHGYIRSVPFAVSTSFLTCLCFMSGALLAAREAPRSRILHGTVALVAISCVAWLLAKGL